MLSYSLRVLLVFSWYSSAVSHLFSRGVLRSATVAPERPCPGLTAVVYPLSNWNRILPRNSSLLMTAMFTWAARPGKNGPRT